MLSEFEPRIIGAIRGQVPLLLDYFPGVRLIEPHTYGYGHMGQLLLLAYQVWGASLSGRHTGWKLFRLDRAISLDYAAEGPPEFTRRPGFRWDDPRFHRVLAQVYVPACERREERIIMKEQLQNEETPEKKPRNRATPRPVIGVMSAFHFFDHVGSEEAAIKFFEEARWGERGVICPHCDSASVYEVKNRRPQSHRCRPCRRYFSVRTGTALAETNLPLKKWAFAAYLMITSRKGVSARYLEWQLGLTEKTCWHLGHRLRAALLSAVLKAEPMSGEVEVDELYVGGKLEVMHRDRREKFGYDSHANKIPVLGIVERATGRAFLTVVPDVSGATLQPIIRRVVKPGTIVYTDEHGGYRGLNRLGYTHETIRHKAKQYVRGRVHTNSIESAFGRFRRMYTGIHHVMSTGHLNLYLGEFSYHEAHRGNSMEALALVFRCLFDADKLSFDDLTGGTQ